MTADVYTGYRPVTDYATGSAAPVVSFDNVSKQYGKLKDRKSVV